MSYNPSLDFLNMIKKDADYAASKSTASNKSIANSIDTKANRKKTENEVEIGRNKSIPMASVTDDSRKKTEKVINEGIIRPTNLIAVIDTETNWHDEVMSIGIALADSETFKCCDTRYYIIDPEYRVGGIYSNVLHYRDNGSRELSFAEVTLSRSKALQELKNYLKDNKVTKIFAYNAKFDYGHLRELDDFEWYDIMRLAAYKQYNSAITEIMACCKTGRLRTNYGVEPITRMLTGDNYYCEIHNAIYDAVDELRIIELLGHELSQYECAKIN